MIRAIMRWLDAKPEPKSILRQVVLDQGWDPEDVAGSLLSAALLVQRAGLTHLVGIATGAEIQALAAATEQIAKERTATLVRALLDPGETFRPFDGGEFARKATLRDARDAVMEAIHG